MSTNSPQGQKPPSPQRRARNNPKHKRRASPKKSFAGELAIPDFKNIEAAAAVSILNDIDPRNSSIEITGVQFRHLVEGLNKLYNAAYAEYRRAHRFSVASEDLKGLIEAIDSFRSRLDVFDSPHAGNPLPDLFQAATLQMQRLSQPLDTLRAAGARPFNDILSRLDTALEEIRDVIVHLQQFKTAFQKKSKAERWTFFFDQPTRLDTTVNQALYPYLVNGAGLGPDTYIARHIEALYKETFGAHISYSRIKPEFHDQPASVDKDPRQFHNGPALRFACAIIRELKLYKFMSPGLISDPDAPLPWNLEESGGLISPWEVVKNRIATIWENDKKRSDKSELYS